MSKSKGTREFKDGTIYEGNCFNCNLDGIGRIISNDGNVYQGEFKENVATGFGEFYSFNGDVYRGKFEDSKATGKGHYTHKYGMFYDGEFKDGTFHGNGQLTVPGKYVCNGVFVEGSLEGKGEVEWIDGTGRIFKGEFWKGQFFGTNCYYKDEEGNTYEGGYRFGEKSSEWKVFKAMNDEVATNPST